MPYGYGIHTCFGLYLNRIRIPIIVTALVGKDNLARTSGAARKIEMDGQFFRHFRMEFSG